MVYNTTDNSTSMNITDLTPGGVYSVTVAGRDGAGRLGQELIKELPEAIGTSIDFCFHKHIHCTVIGNFAINFCTFSPV